MQVAEDTEPDLRQPNKGIILEDSKTIDDLVGSTIKNLEARHYNPSIFYDNNGIKLTPYNLSMDGPWVRNLVFDGASDLMGLTKRVNDIMERLRIRIVDISDSYNDRTMYPSSINRKGILESVKDIYDHIRSSLLDKVPKDLAEADLKEAYGF